MIRHALITAFRNLLRYKENLAINLIGMTIGISAVIIIISYVYTELRVGTELGGRKIYRVETETNSNIGTVHKSNYPTGKFLIDNLPEVKKACLVNKDKMIVYYNNQGYELKEAIRTDSLFFDFYKSSVILGNLDEFQRIPYPVVLTESTAKKIFGDKNPIGEEVENKQFRMTVIAVIKDVPADHLNQFEAVINEKGSRTQEQIESWTWFGYMFLLELEDKAKPQYVAEFLNNQLAKRHPYAYNKYGFRHRLTAYRDIYFDNSISNDVFIKGNRKFVIFFIAVAMFMLAIAIINSINLTRAQWVSRIREISVRKTFGANRRAIYFQLIGETVLVNLGCFILSLGLIYVVLPSFNQLKSLLLLLQSPLFIAIIFLLYIIIGIIVGLLASFNLTNIHIKKGLKGDTSYLNNRYGSKIALVGFQFLVSTVLIACILGINKQINFMMLQDIGFNKENLVEFTIPSFEKYDALRNELLENPSVNEVSFSDGILNPSIQNITHGLVYDGITSRESFPIISADHNFPKIMNFKIVQGVGFNQYPRGIECIINSTAAKKYGIDDLDKGAKINNIPIVGIIEDYNFSSLHETIGPLIIFRNVNAFIGVENIYDRCAVKISSSNPSAIKDAINHINITWKRIGENKPLSLRFVDDEINMMYKKETDFQRVLNVFSLLTIIITVMGLFGISLNIVKSRTKEIGIRKINGASVFLINKMLNMIFLKWVIASSVVAYPISFFILNRWLESFAYKTVLSWWIFALAGIIAFAIAVITISWQVSIAASKNPLETLRYE